MRYKILTGNSPEELRKKVQGCVMKGWEPLGSHTCVRTSLFGSVVWSQSLIKRLHDSYDMT